MASFNRVILCGNLTRDPELRHIPSGTAVTEVGLAVNDKFKKGNDWVDEVSFVDIVFWGKTAEIVCQYLNKGSWVSVSGEPRLTEYKGKQYLELSAHQVSLCGGAKKQDAEQAPAPRKADTSKRRVGGMDADDDPFG